MNNMDIRKRFAVVFMIIGLIGSIFVLFTSPVSGPLIELSKLPTPILFILYIPFYIMPGILSFAGSFGCNIKTDSCESEFFTGLILNTIVFYLLGYLIGAIFFQKNK